MNDGLKQRLVGAVVLLALAVIFLPVLFKDQPGHTVDTRTLIPEPPVFEPDVYAPPQRPEGIVPAPQPETMFLADTGDDAYLDDPPNGDENGSEEVATAPLEPRVEIPRADEAIPDAWVVQVGSFRSAEAATRLRDRLQREGYAAYTRSLATDSGEVSRVLIGPKIEREDALAIKAEVDRMLSVESLVVRFQP